jgi:hypothetical protein
VNRGLAHLTSSAGTASHRFRANSSGEQKSINDIPLDFDLSGESNSPVDDGKGGKQGSELSRYYDRAVFLLIPKINRGFI